ncbi:RNase adapter RapZ [Kordiimonas marina]|uniref:RNase adapter RapZ n=1 Tax=Kordiimonas marina TaxID=2872312 RepID=UPI001FF13B60|nr:RNase adapter RapZ [Kordiimonas marina]MCJ9428307.1 RNase adapter RapZ [Kordiimonas marina]
MTETPIADPAEDGRRQLVIVTGLSGAGKSSALNAFEDIGYQVIDNLPLTLLSDLLNEMMTGDDRRPIAVGIDSRTLHFSPGQFTEAVQGLRTRPDIHLHVLFMDAADDVLMKRFSETRRVHPLGEGKLLRAAIRQERDLMAAIRPVIDGLIDTSTRTGAETRRVVLSRFAAHQSPDMIVTFMSFGFANGVPRDADLVFDVRFLRNPHYVPDLKPLTGREEAVANYVRADEAFGPFVDKVTDLLGFLLPRYQAEGKSYLTLAFGCTGGKHRSVTMVETLAPQMALDGLAVNLYHRELSGDEGR